MRELDVMLAGFCADTLPQLVDSELDALAELLELADPQLYAYLAGNETVADPAQKALVARIQSATAKRPPDTVNRQTAPTEAAPEWAAFLRAEGDAEPEVSTCAEIDPRHACLVDLKSLAVITVTGKGAREFLSGQFTCDLESMDPSRYMTGAWCNPQGQVICTFRLFVRDGRNHLIVPRDLSRAITDRLRMYVLRADVVVNGPDEDYAVLGLSGGRSGQLLGSALDVAGLGTKGAASSAAVTALLLSSAQPRYCLALDQAAGRALWRQFRRESLLGHEDIWFAMEIESGWPWIGTATREQYLPQVLNLESFGGLSLDKGCFPGQEVIARLHYRGSLKRRSQLAYLRSTEIHIAGEAVVDDKGKTVGQLIDARRVDADRHAILAVIAVDALSVPLHLDNANGPVLELSEFHHS